MRFLLRTLLAFAALTVAAGASLVAVGAAAAPVPETGEPGLLTLRATPYPAENLTIARGERMLWPVTAELNAPSAGQLTVRVTAEQPLAEDAAALRFELASCDSPWALPPSSAGTATCEGGAGVIEIPEAPFATTDSGRVWSLGEIVPDESRYFLVTLSLPLSTPGSLATESAEVGFGFAAADSTLIHAGPPGMSRLAHSGGTFLGPALLGLGLLGGGAVLARLRSLREAS